MNQKQNRNFSLGNSSPKNSFSQSNSGLNKGYSNKDVINYPVYFFRPVEIDGKLWVPQPVFPEMLNWDQQKGEFNIPSAPAAGDISKRVKQQVNEPVFKPYAIAGTSQEPQKKTLRPIERSNVKNAVPVAEGAVAKQAPKVDFNSNSSKFVAPKVQDKKEKPAKNVKSGKKTNLEPESIFAEEKVKAVKADGFLSKLLRILIWILIALFIYLEIMLVASKPNSNGDVSLIFGKGVVQQDSKDMYPSVNYGDLCFIGKQSSYNVNTVVVYKNANNELVIHRFLGVDSSGKARAKGDAQKTLDEAFNKADIIGKVEFSIPLLGFLVTFYVDKVILVLLVVSLIACYRWKAKRKHT